MYFSRIVYADFGKLSVIEIEGLLFLGFGPMLALQFFPSSDVTSALKIFQLKSSIFERPRDVTWWEKPVFHEARTLGQNPGIANLLFQFQ